MRVLFLIFYFAAEGTRKYALPCFATFPGRAPGFPGTPPQTRTSPIKAYGSSNYDFAKFPDIVAPPFRVYGLGVHKELDTCFSGSIEIASSPFHHVSLTGDSANSAKSGGLDA
jgi:hypothetical protein